MNTHHLLNPLRLLISAFLCLPGSMAVFAGTEDSAGEPPSATPGQPQLATFEKLWTSSMFTSQEMKVEVPEVTNAEWAANLQLSGWSEVDGQLSVYLFRSDTGQTFILQQGEPDQKEVMQFVAIENTETIIDARVRVRLNGQEAWISQQKEAAAPPQPITGSQPAQPATSGLQAPVTVDSRAALLRAGVVLTADTTFEDSLSQPEKSASSTPDATSGATEAGKPRAEVLQRLRERHEHLYRMFPRPAGGP